MTESPQWTWNDGWILMSLFLTRNDEGTRLHEIIAAADATNHAIPTVSEMSHSLTKLVQCRLVHKEDGKYSICPEYLESLEKAHDGRGGLFASGDKGLKWLKRSDLGIQESMIIEVTEEEMKDAYEQYMKAVRKK